MRRVSLNLWLVAAGLAVSAGCKNSSPAPAASPTPAPAVPPAAPPAAAPVPTPEAPATAEKAPTPEPAPPAPPAPAPPSPPAVAPAPPQPEPGAAPTADRAALPGPTIERRTGPIPATTASPATVKATGVLAQDGVVYIDLPVETLCPGCHGDAIDIRVKGDRYGLAATTTHEPKRALVRLTGGQVLPEKLELDVVIDEHRSTRNPQPTKRQTLTVEGIAGATANKELRKDFFTALAGELDARAWDNPFYAFARGRVTRLAEGSDTAALVAQGRVARSDVAEMMSLYSGLTSMEEAVQSDRGLGLRADKDAKATVAIDDVMPVPLPPHDWATLMGGKEPALEPLASAVPADALYVHFHDLRTAVYLGRELDEWLTPVLPLMDSRSGPSHLVERYQEQLVIERTALSEALGHVVSDGIALVIGDPFVREGTDVSIVFKVKSRDMLLTSLAGFEAKARARYPMLMEAKYQLSGREVRRITTPDRAIDQHRLELGDLLILSNSSAALERFVAVADGKEKPLAQSGDFRYMRLQHPFDKAAEDGYVFISDAFVTKAVSPRARILEARRVAAAGDLRAAGYATLLYGLLEGAPPATVDDLKRIGVLQDADLKHSDGAAITLDLQKGASSEPWGRPLFMKPLAEMTIDKVTEAEKQAYDRFREGYQNYWRTFIDPIGVRLKVDAAAGRIAVDTRIMPLIDGTDYSELRRWAGKAQFKPGSADGVAQWTVGIGQDSELRRSIGFVSGILGGQANFDWIGGYAYVGFASGGALLDALLMTGEVPEAGEQRRPKDDEWVGLLDRLPLYAGVEVSNPLTFAATVAAVRGFLETAAPGVVTWSDGGKHRDVPMTQCRASMRGFTDVDKAIDLFYAVPKGVWVIAFDKVVLEGQIDAILDGKSVQPVADGATGVQADMHVSPGAQPWMRQAIELVLDGELRHQWLKAHHDAELLRLATGTYPTGEDARARALAFLGYEPAVVQGGEFTPTDGGLRHSIYGTPAEPIVPPLPVAGSPVARLIASLQGLDFSLSFVGEGPTSGLHVVGSWVRQVK